MFVPDLNQSYDWSFPIPLLYGPGRLAELGALCQCHGVTNALIVTDRASRDLPFVQGALDALAAAGLKGAVFSDVAPNPTDQNAEDGLAAYRAGGHDGVVAIGGGSGMDAGKAISLLAGKAGDIWRFDYDLEVDDSLSAGDFPPLFCIPTTSGTGAESESTAMVTDTKALTKRCIWHPTHHPRAAILDPVVTLGLPPKLTAWTGIDALVHAIEAYCVPDFNPLCDGMALQGLELVSAGLPQVMQDPASIPARGTMIVGSCLAGIAFLKGLGLVHSISHMVGAEFDTHHGLTNAVLLPIVLRYNEAAITAKVRPMSQAMALETTDFESFYAAVCALLDDCDIPRSLADIGVETDEAGIQRLAAKAVRDAATGTNAAEAGVPEIADLIRRSLVAAR
ncbi:MAG: iron-containing alcohol dehydrogenase [Alphaproteobacteria bacterium]